MSTSNINEVMIRDLPMKYSYNEYDHIIIEGRDGTKLAPLASIINEYASKILFYDTVDDLKHTQFLELGSIVMTLGNRYRGDGGGAIYRIETGISLDANDSTIIELYNKPLLKAVLIIEPEMNVKQFGAYGDGSHDDTSMIREAISKCDIISFPKGKYLITATINIPDNKQLIGPGTVLTKNSNIINIENVHGLYIDGLNMQLSNNNCGIIIKHSSDITITDFCINKVSDDTPGAINIQDSNDIILQRFTINGEYDTGNGIYFENSRDDENNIQRVIIKDGIFNNVKNGIYSNICSIDNITVENCKFSFLEKDDRTCSVYINYSNAFININNCYMDKGNYGIRVDNYDDNYGKLFVNSLTVKNTKKVYTFNTINTELILSGVHNYQSSEEDYLFNIVNNPIRLLSMDFINNGYTLLNPRLNIEHNGSLSDMKYPQYNLLNPIVAKVTEVRSVVDVSKYTFANTVLYLDFIGSSDLNLLITGIIGGLNGQIIYVVGDSNVIIPENGNGYSISEETTLEPYKGIFLIRRDNQWVQL